MHIGLIGGIGPAATVAYYLKLVEAFKAAKLNLELTIVHADINQLAPNAASGQKNIQAKIFSNHLSQLKSAGCDVAMLTAMTAHFCFEETEALSPIKMISGTQLIDSYCKKHQIKSLGLLGSPPVLATHLFGLLKQVGTVVPETGREALGQTYMNLAHNGRCTDEQRTQLITAGAALVSEQNADAVLLAGTDLGLAFDNVDAPYPVIDAVDVHVAALVEMARG